MFLKQGSKSRQKVRRLVVVVVVIVVVVVDYNNNNNTFSVFKKNLNASKPSEHPPQVEECLKV